MNFSLLSREWCLAPWNEEMIIPAELWLPRDISRLARATPVGPGIYFYCAPTGAGHKFSCVYVDNHITNADPVPDAVLAILSMEQTKLRFIQRIPFDEQREN